MIARPPRDTGETAGTILKGAGVTLAGSIVGGVLLLVNEILAARYLGGVAYGLYALAFTLAKIGETISLFGLRMGVYHYLAIYRSQGQNALVIGTVLAAVILPLAAGCASACLVWQLAPWIAGAVFHQPEAIPYIRWIALSIPLMSLLEILVVITRGFGYSRYHVVVRNFIFPLTFLTLLLVFKSLDVDGIWIAAVFGLAYATGAIAAGFTVVRVTGPLLLKSRPSIPFRQLYLYSLPVLVNAILANCNLWADILILGAYVPADRVGIYRACMRIVLLFTMIITAFSTSTSHIYPVLAREKRQSELRVAYGTAIRWISLLSLAAYLVIVLNASDILSLMGPGFSEGWVTLVILASGQLIQSCLGSAQVVLLVTGHQKMDTVVAAVGAVANIALNLILIPRFGLIGAAVATSLSLVLMNVLRVMLLRSRMGLATGGVSVLRILAAASLVAVFVVPVIYLFDVGNGNGVGWMVVRILGTGALLSLALWNFGIDREERARVRSLLRAIRFRAPGQSANHDSSDCARRPW